MVSISGRLPKENRSRARDNHRDDMRARTILVPDKRLRGPRLPSDIVWPRATKLWWETWRRSPQAQIMVDTDWSAMLEAARMHRLLWSETADELKPGEAAALSRELHRITANYGLTYCDRLKLRIRIDGETEENSSRVESPPPEAVPDNVVDMYRRKLGA